LLLGAAAAILPEEAVAPRIIVAAGIMRFIMVLFF
jgi:hypothetical protein